MDNLKLIKQVGFDFSWDEKKVWSLHEPVISIPIEQLIWHFDVPFWFEKGDIYNLSPAEVMGHPELHKEEWERIQRADTSHPLDIMENKSRWLLLDGLHRLAKLYLKGDKKIKVRMISRGRIPEIMNLDETVNECVRTLKEEFPHVYAWKDEPNAEYKEHAHKGKVSFFVIEGGLTFQYEDDQPIELIPGDRMDVRPHKNHTAKVGPKGCHYIVGEVIEEDS